VNYEKLELPNPKHHAKTANQLFVADINKISVNFLEFISWVLGVAVFLTKRKFSYGGEGERKSSLKPKLSHYADFRQKV